MQKNKELLEKQTSQESQLKQALSKVGDLEKSAMDTSAMLDRSSIMTELPDNIQAVIDPDN